MSFKKPKLYAEIVDESFNILKWNDGNHHHQQAIQQQQVLDDNSTTTDDYNGHIESLERKMETVERTMMEINNKLDKVVRHENEIAALKKQLSCTFSTPETSPAPTIESCIQKRFLKLVNKWERSAHAFSCCVKKCGIFFPNRVCMSGNGFVQFYNGTATYHRAGKTGGINQNIRVLAKNAFNRCFSTGNDFHYFEVALQSVEQGFHMVVGLFNEAGNLFRVYEDGCFYTTTNNGKVQKLALFGRSLIAGDVVGCGLFFQAGEEANDKNARSKVFFTLNGQLKAGLIPLETNVDGLTPYVNLVCCSVETNFGNDDTKPFLFNICNNPIIES